VEQGEVVEITDRGRPVARLTPLPKGRMRASGEIEPASGEIEDLPSDTLRKHLRQRSPLVSSALARTEVLRALLPGGEHASLPGGKSLAESTSSVSSPVQPPYWLLNLVNWGFTGECAPWDLNPQPAD
jgi:antitoxin (DNA-binding transcriptional repressor) of toxin-antitoxin stability system